MIVLVLTLASCSVSWVFHAVEPEDPSAPGTQESGEQQAPGKPRSFLDLPEGFVRFSRVPEGGLYPRIAVGKEALAVLSYKGSEDRGDLFVSWTGDEGKTFSPGLRVNSAQGSVASADSRHGGSIDLGADGAAHVVWATGGDERSLRYIRVQPGRESGESVDLGVLPGLCRSPAVAVDGRGRIFVFYAAASDPAELQSVPPLRQVWMRTSDDGLGFSEPVVLDDRLKSVSEHSALAAHIDEVMGTIFVLYRTGYALKPNSPSLSRGMRLLSSTDGTTFAANWVDNWRGVRDPRSNALLSQEESSTLAVWESGGDVFWSVIRRQVKKMNMPITPRTDGPPVTRERPSGAAGEGEVLLTWLQRPKDDPEAAPKLAWRVWMREGRAPIGEGLAPEPPLAGAPAVFARARGGFTVLY